MPLPSSRAQLQPLYVTTEISLDDPTCEATMTMSPEPRLSYLAEPLEFTGVYALSQELDVDFSITVATDSDVYFGADKGSLRPEDGEDLKSGFEFLINRHFRSFHPRSVARGWFEKSLLDYTRGQGACSCMAMPVTDSSIWIPRRTSTLATSSRLASEI